MEMIPRERYTNEFREEAVKLITDEDLSLPDAGRRLYISPSTIGNGVKAHKAGRLAEVCKSQRLLTELEMELYRTKRELAKIRGTGYLKKKQPRTLRRSRCKVCDDRRTAASLSGSVCKTSSQCLS